MNGSPWIAFRFCVLATAIAMIGVIVGFIGLCVGMAVRNLGMFHLSTAYVLLAGGVATGIIAYRRWSNDMLFSQGFVRLLLSVAAAAMILVAFFITCDFPEQRVLFFTTLSLLVISVLSGAFCTFIIDD